EKYFPLFSPDELETAGSWSPSMNFLSLNANQDYNQKLFQLFEKVPGLVICLYSDNENPVLSTRRFLMELISRGIDIPVILAVECSETTIDRQLIHFSIEAGALLADGMGDG